MSSTNQTTHYGLPEFVPTDKPAWLVDWNGAMSDIDTAIYTAETKADAAAAAAATATGDVASLASSVTSIQSQVTTLTDGVTHAQGDINTINSLIGSGEPTTQDKTIIGAINELAAEIPSGGDVAAEDVTYDNTSSGLTATDVQSAIDEIQNEVENFSPEVVHRRIVSIGDSYAAQDASMNYNNMLATMFGSDVDFYPVAEGGIGFAHTGLDGHTALTLLQSVESTISNHGTITDFVITVGVNDSIDDTVYNAAKTAIVTFINYVKTNYPKAKIWYAFIGNFFSASDSGHSALRKSLLLESVPEFYEIFEKNGCGVMRGAEFIMHDARNCQSANPTHPNAEGAENIAQFIFTWFNEGYAKYQTHYEYSDGATGAHICADIDGDTTTVLVLSWPSGTAGTASGLTDILTLPSDFPVRGDSNYHYPIYDQLALTTANGYQWVIAFIENKKVQISPNPAVTYTSATKLRITIPTMYA